MKVKPHNVTVNGRRDSGVRLIAAWDTALAADDPARRRIVAQTFLRRMRAF